MGDLNGGSTLVNIEQQIGHAKSEMHASNDAKLHRGMKSPNHSCHGKNFHDTNNSIVKTNNDLILLNGICVKLNYYKIKCNK